MGFFGSRRRLFGRRTPRRPVRRGYYAALLLVAAGVVVLVLGQRFPQEAADARARLAGPVSGILETLQLPMKPLLGLNQRYRDYVQIESELARLRAENDELKGWRWRAVELERRLADLSELNKVVHEPGVEFITTMIRARSVGTMSGSALLGAGAKAGVKPNAAVLNSRGLVGATFEVGPRTSRVLFLTDKASRVLVSIGPSLVTGVAVGTGRRRLAIRKGGRPLDIAIGDEVITAGEVGGVPRGLRVGRVVTGPFGLRIEPYVDFDRLEFVSILMAGAQESAALSKDGDGRRDEPAPARLLRFADDRIAPAGQ
jgi:rod shape-determining protein MreC